MNHNVQLILGILQKPVMPVTTTPATGTTPSALPVVSEITSVNVQDDLFQRFFDSAEESRSWMETGIDVWLDAAWHWLAAARYGWVRMNLYEQDEIGSKAYTKTESQAFVDLLKAHWISVDVVSKHPQRPFITSASRQAPIAKLVRCVGEELQRWQTSARLFELVEETLRTWTISSLTRRRRGQPVLFS